MTLTAHPALVLNADFRPMSYFPLSLLSWQDAVAAVFGERVAVVAEYDHWVRSPSMRMRLPSVVALRKYQRSARRVAFTRYNVFLRDGFTCQYCGGAFPAADLTFEHVIPRSRGGQTTWTNIVSAASPATRAKAADSASSRGVRRRSRRCASCWMPGATSRPTTSTRAGWTTSTGTRNWRAERSRSSRSSEE
jgi:5-methylcytosine-specific restriction endonuclease McrA